MVTVVSITPLGRNPLTDTAQETRQVIVATKLVGQHEVEVHRGTHNRLPGEEHPVRASQERLDVIKEHGRLKVASQTRKELMRVEESAWRRRGGG